MIHLVEIFSLCCILRIHLICLVSALLNTRHNCIVTVLFVDAYFSFSMYLYFTEMLRLLAAFVMVLYSEQ